MHCQKETAHQAAGAACTTDAPLLAACAARMLTSFSSSEFRSANDSCADMR